MAAGRVLLNALQLLQIRAGARFCSSPSVLLLLKSPEDCAIDWSSMLLLNIWGS